MPEEGKPGFTITDRRASAGGGEERPEEPQRVLPPVDFTTFVLSLGSSALMHLGEGQGEGEGEGEGGQKDLDLAKHTIDLLEVLQEKTKGNLTSHEEQLLQTLLYDVRLRYVAAAKP